MGGGGARHTIILSEYTACSHAVQLITAVTLTPFGKLCCVIVMLDVDDVVCTFEQGMSLFVPTCAVHFAVGGGIPFSLVNHTLY
jgi:hypothetical protein